MTPDPSSVPETERAGAFSSRDARVLLIEQDAKQARQLGKTLRALVGTVDVRTELSPLPNDTDYDMLIVDYDTLDGEERQALLSRFGAKRSRTRLLLLSGGLHRADLIALFGAHSLTNLIAKKESVDPTELIVTIRKILSGDILGIEKYFIWGVRPVVMSVRGSKDKAALIERAERFASNIGINPRFTSQLCSVADELVTNAVYNAPVDGEGRHRFADWSRRREIQLDPHEEVVVKYCCDGHRLAISITDPFGSLTMDRVLDYLAKCLRKEDDQVDEKEGGAGLGLYYIFDALSHFIVNLKPGSVTEMVGIMEIKGTYKDFSARPKSFNLFTAP